MSVLSRQGSLGWGAKVSRGTQVRVLSCADYVDRFVARGSGLLMDERMVEERIE